MKDCKVCLNKGPDPVQRGDKHKKAIIGLRYLKNFLKSHCPRKAHIYMKAS
jgi:hypothetical protein